MSEALLYTLLSVGLVSILSLIGSLSLLMKGGSLKRVIFVLVGFSAGALFGDAFIHLIPEAIEEGGDVTKVGLFVLLGVLIFFTFEKFLHWYHHHDESEEEQKEHHPLGGVVLVADGLHNFIDGIIIAASFLISIPVGIATTLAVIAHEIPQEIGDFGLLLHAGFSRARALLFNFISALASFAGAFLVFLIADKAEVLALYLVPLAAGGFIYIAGSDLVPELHKHKGLKQSFIQLLSVGVGVLLMISLLYLE